MSTFNSEVLRYLGTKVSDNHPSCVGFRLLLRNNNEEKQSFEAAEERYHVLSIRCLTEGNKLSHGLIKDQSILELLQAHVPGIDPGKTKIYAIHFELETGFEITRHGADPDLSKPTVVKALQDLEVIKRSKRVSLYFQYDMSLVTRLTQTIDNGCVGSVAPRWSDALPLSAEPTWPANTQTTM